MARIIDRYKTNPFARDTVVHTVTGTRMIYANPTGDTDRFAVVSRDDGEDHGDISFGKRITCDKTQFLKFFADGVRMFLGLKSAGIKVFMIVYQELIDGGKNTFNADSIILKYELLEDDVQAQISESTFYRGIRELKKVHFIAPSMVEGIYWINTDYVFKGDRLTLVNQYVMNPDYEEQLSGGRPLVDTGHTNPMKKQPKRRNVLKEGDESK